MGRKGFIYTRGREGSLEVAGVDVERWEIAVRGEEGSGGGQGRVLGLRQEGVAGVQERGAVCGMGGGGFSAE